MNQYLNLIRKMTWSFYKTTGIEWEELFSEASLAYCEAMQSYQEDRAKESTWIYYCIRNRLINFCKQEGRAHNIMGIEEWYDDVLCPDYEFFEERFGYLSEDVKWIIRMVLKNPDRYRVVGRKAMGLISRDLREKKNWKYPRIWNGMRALRRELCEIT